MSTPKAEAQKVSACRICGGTELVGILDLGQQPLPNRLLTQADPKVPRYPLAVCQCQGCHLVQLDHIVQPDLMFSHYLYVSGTSSIMRAHFADYARSVEKEFLEGGGRLLEIGSNDGTFLSGFSAGIKALGVEPATNLAEEAKAAGHDTRNAFFGAQEAQAIRREWGAADVVVGNNVIAHIPDLTGVLQGVDALLADDGVFILEAPGWMELLETLAFDTIYHEHMSYFTLAPLQTWAAQRGMRIFRADATPVHFGSMRVFFDRGKRPVEGSVGARLEKERQVGVADKARNQRFAQQVRALLDAFSKLIREQGPFTGYAAPAKATVLLNAANIDAGGMVCVVDNNPKKQGAFIPGVDIPIVSREQWLEKGDLPCMILAGNIAAELVKDESDFTKKGGSFWVAAPLPHPISG